MEFSRQEYCSGLPFPSPGDLSKSGTEPRSPSLQAVALLSEPPRSPPSLGWINCNMRWDNGPSRLVSGDSGSVYTDSVPLADGLLSVLSPTSPGHPERVLLTVSRSHREATQLTSFLCEEQHLHLTYARSAYSQKSSH